MAIEEEEAGGIPEWVVTFGDMMSLLLTFFIMLVSFSEIKEEEKYQGMVESIRRRFGHQESIASPMPGEHAPRNSNNKEMATMGRAKREGLQNGATSEPAPSGDYPKVRIIRPGSRTAVGSVFVFQEMEVELSDIQRSEIDLLIDQLVGKPQKIEVRGHASLRPLSSGGSYQENWKLAFERAQNTMDYLVERGIEEYRIRLAVAGPWEPFVAEADPDKLWLNPRVEVFLLDEVPDDPQTTAATPQPDAPATPETAADTNEETSSEVPAETPPDTP